MNYMLSAGTFTIHLLPLEDRIAGVSIIILRKPGTLKAGDEGLAPQRE